MYFSMYSKPFDAAGLSAMTQGKFRGLSSVFDFKLNFVFDFKSVSL